MNRNSCHLFLHFQCIKIVKFVKLFMKQILITRRLFLIKNVKIWKKSQKINVYYWVRSYQILCNKFHWLRFLMIKHYTIHIRNAKKIFFLIFVKMWEMKCVSSCMDISKDSVDRPYKVNKFHHILNLMIFQKIKKINKVIFLMMMFFHFKNYFLI